MLNWRLYLNLRRPVPMMIVNAFVSLLFLTWNIHTYSRNTFLLFFLMPSHILIYVHTSSSSIDNSFWLKIGWSVHRKTMWSKIYIFYLSLQPTPHKRRRWILLGKSCMKQTKGGTPYAAQTFRWSACLREDNTKKKNHKAWYRSQRHSRLACTLCDFNRIGSSLLHVIVLHQNTVPDS